MSSTGSVPNSDSISAAATESALSPDSAAMATAQSALPLKSSPPAANPLSVPPVIPLTTAATMTSTPEHHQRL
ncbi:hypothetical protein C0995_013990, partial [Termitomyces sp. Mi166